jgi:acetyltransferase EpsM
VGYIDPEPNAHLERLGLAWWGDDEAGANRLVDEYLLLTVGGVSAVAVRRSLADRYATAGCSWASVVHPSVAMAEDTTVGDGVAVLARAVLNPGVRVGAHGIVNTGAIVEHDVQIGRNVQVGPGAVIGGGAVIGDDAFIGLGAAVRDHVRIGAGAVIGMGSVVINDVPPGAAVAGVPARAIRISGRGGGG